MSPTAIASRTPLSRVSGWTPPIRVFEIGVQHAEAVGALPAEAIGYLTPSPLGGHLKLEGVQVQHGRLRLLEQGGGISRERRGEVGAVAAARYKNADE